MQDLRTEERSAVGTQQRPCQVFDLGLREYQEAFQLQKTLQQARIAGSTVDSVLALQHYPVITLGKSGNKENLLVAEEFLAEERVAVVHSNRGGDVTFHNPGQLVVYLVFDLRSLYGATYYRSVYRYVRDLEEVTLRLLVGFGLVGHRVRGYPGVWLGNSKICAIGLNVSHWVTMHGFALNVNNDLQISSYIHPCGIRDKDVTSLSKVLQREITVEEALPLTLMHLSNVFNLDIDCRGRDLLSIPG